MLSPDRESLPLFMGMHLATPPTSAINPSKHYSTSSSKRTTLPSWTNWPSTMHRKLAR